MTDTTNIMAYQSAMVQAYVMLRKGILEDKDIVSIEDKLAQKYGLQFGSIYRETDFINIRSRGNMSHYKEVDIVA